MAGMSIAVSLQSARPLQGPEGDAPPARGSAAAREAPPPKPGPPFTNPDLRLDPALGLVVIEFHDDAGKLTNSIPSQRQIDAYRRDGQARPARSASGPAPPAQGAPGPDAATASGAPVPNALIHAPSVPNASMRGSSVPGAAPTARALPAVAAPKGGHGETPAG